MKKEMKTMRKMLLILVCLILAAPCMNVSAASQKQKALEAYKNLLSQPYVNVVKKGTSYVEYSMGADIVYDKSKASDVMFDIAYINNDKIPELILYAKHSWLEYYGIMTYKNGNVYRLFNSNGDDLIKGYYKKTGCFHERSLTGGSPYHDNYYKMSGVKAVKKISKFSYSIYSKKADYYIGGKKTSKSAFNARLKKLTKKKAKTSVKLTANTQANRDSRLK